MSPLPPPVGGIASWTVHVLNYLNKSDLNNFSRFAHLNSGLKIRNVAINSLVLRLLLGIFEFLLFFPRAFYVLISFRPSIVHLASSGSFGFFRDSVLVFVCWLFQMEVILHVRFGRIPEILKYKTWEYFVLRFLLKFVDVFLFIDIPSYSAITSSFPELHDKFKYIPNPASTYLTNEARSPLSVKKPIALFVGHLIPTKGVIELAKGFSKLDSAYKLIFIGPEIQSVKSLIIDIFSEADFSNYEFLGSQDQSVVYSFMKDASILILPSYTEGFPNVVIEAMSHGCPVLATSVGAIPDMLGINTNESAGICFDLDDLDKMEEILTRVFCSSVDLEGMGRNGKIRISAHYSIEIVMRQYFQLWGFPTTKQ